MAQATSTYATRKVPVTLTKLGGGLNTASGPLGLQDNESSDLQNIDFDRFGSILKRNGYTYLNSTATTGTANSDGTFWHEYTASGARVEKLIKITAGKIYKMDGLDGTWDDITGAVTITADHRCDFESFLNTLLVTNNYDVPFKWDASGNAAALTVPTNLTRAKFIKQFQNYTILANCFVDGVKYGSRIYWSTIKTAETWDDTDFLEVSFNDGQDINGIKVLGDSLIIYKNRAIYKMLFTGDRDVPFIVAKTNSNVGCSAPWSIQEVDNGHVFVSYDGLYFFDGNNSYKISDRINPTFTGLNRLQMENFVSMYQKDKNRYWLGCAGSASNTNDKVLVWDSANNAFSIYSGILASAMTMVYVNGFEERPYFSDYLGYDYRADFGSSDYPSKVETSINAYYYTNWKYFEDIVSQKGISQIYIYYQINDTVLTYGYSYDFESGTQYSNTLDMSGGGALWDAAEWDVDEWSREGGNVGRIDMTGRGRVVRFYFANNVKGDTFQIDGIGNYGNAETSS